MARRKTSTLLLGYQRRLKGKVLIGLTKDQIVLNDRSWWRLAEPSPTYGYVRLDLCSRRITDVRIAKDRLQLTLSRPGVADVCLFLHWMDKDGNLTQPQLPDPARIKASIPGDEEDWTEIDASLDIIEAITCGVSND